jgi:hypothetical protein
MNAPQVEKSARGYLNLAAQAALSHARLLEMLAYDANTGIFTWRIRPHKHGAKVGDIAGSRTQRYCRVSINGYRYPAHRLAWFYVHGEWPENELDHRLRISTDNRLSELRPATRSQNAINRGLNKNNTSGAKGVRWNIQAKRWLAFITKDGRKFHLGGFKNFNEAVAARQQTEQRLFGEFARGAA